MRSLSFAATLLAAGGCATSAPPAKLLADASQATAGRLQPPRGAVIGPSGFATVLSAPPAPYPFAPPQDPSLDGANRSNQAPYAAANPDQEASAAAQRLMMRLRAEAGDNFVDARIVRDPRPRYLFHFRRDAAATLARFTTDPRFIAAEGGVPAEELEPLAETWSRRFAPRRLSGMHGINAFEGVVEMHLGLSRAEYEAIAAEEGWPAPPARVRLVFASEADEAGAVSPDAAPFVRVFARADRSPGIILTGGTRGRIVLRDGCFRVDDGRGGGRLVLFGREAVLRRDAQGWLEVASLRHDFERARIGEPMVWGGYPEAVEEESGVKALRARCGGGPVASVGLPLSAYQSRVRPNAITAYAQARRLSRQAAWDRIKACWAREEARAARARPGARAPRDCDSGSRERLF